MTDRPDEAAAGRMPPEPDAAARTSLAAAMPVTAGWFGKLPSLGDFASRRLPDAYVRCWDAWLQAGMRHGSAGHGERWLDLYLTFPVWRFVWPADGAGAAVWCGVLLPSVDRVGRCFPLTIARPCPAARLAAGLDAIELDLGPLAQAGLAALEGDTVDEFDGRVASADAGGGPADTPTALGTATARLLLAGLAGRSVWWMYEAGAVAPTVRIETAVLSPELFASLVAV